MAKYVLEGDIDDLSIEDGGQAQIMTIYPGDENKDEGLFVRIQSWCEGGNSHPEMDILKKSKRLRVTIETLD